MQALSQLSYRPTRLLLYPKSRVELQGRERMFGKIAFEQDGGCSVAKMLAGTEDAPLLAVPQRGRFFMSCLKTRRLKPILLHKASLRWLN